MGMIAKHRRIWTMMMAPFLFVPMFVGLLQTQSATSEPRGTGNAAARIQARANAYLEQNFGLRESFLHANARLRYLLRSPTTQSVAYGAGNWLYLTDDAVFQQSMGQRMRVKLVEQLADIALRLEREQAARGGRFVMAVPPNSQSINRDTLPSWAKVGDVKTEYDVLRDALKERGVPFADLRSLLRDEQKHREIYMQTDTHWNNLGALLAFNEILRQAGHSDWAIDTAQIDLRPFPLPRGGDLARMLGVRDDVTDMQMVYSLKGGSIRSTSEVIVDRPAMPATVTVRDPAAGPGATVMVLGDSFTYKREALLMAHAAKVVWMHFEQCGFDWSVIERYKPDLLILAPTERLALCAPGRVPVNQP